MEQAEFDLLESQPEALIKAIQATKKENKYADYVKQYDPKQHAVNDKATRPDKIIQTDSGASTVKVARLPIAFQKHIVAMAAAFLCGNPVQLQALPADDMEADFLKVLRRHWVDNKLDYDGKTIAKLMMSETEAAELWYSEPEIPGYWRGTVFFDDNVPFRLRMKILANSKGDSLYPVFNAAGDMIAFGRGYTVAEGDKKVEHFDIYTATKKIFIVKTEAGWVAITETNTVGKIPVIYYNQQAPEWWDVQELIDRAEDFLSNQSDTNDYNGSPLLFVEGEITGFAKKGDRGRVIEGKAGAKVQYVSWQQSIESLKFEWQTLRSLIFDLTGTPDISIEQMKSLGTYSGTALKMLFLGAHLKAADKEETFGKSVQRRINYMMAALATFNVKYEEAAMLNVTPKFEYFLPKNFQEIIDMLNTATGGKPTMSLQTAVSANPFVTDPETELSRINEESMNTEVNL